MQRTESPGIELLGVESPGIESPGIKSPGIKSPCIKTCIEKSRKWIPHMVSLFFALVVFQSPVYQHGQHRCGCCD